MLENSLSILFISIQKFKIQPILPHSHFALTHILYSMLLRLSTQCHNNHGFNYSTNLVKGITSNK